MMPYEVVWERRGVYKRVYGDVDAPDFMRSIAETQTDPRFDMMKYSINDFLDVGAVHVTVEDLVPYAASVIGAAYSNPTVQILIVTAREDILALVRRYAAVTPYKVEYFSTREAARLAIPQRYRHADELRA